MQKLFIADLMRPGGKAFQSYIRAQPIECKQQSAYNLVGMGDLPRSGRGESLRETRPKVSFFEYIK